MSIEKMLDAKCEHGISVKHRECLPCKLITLDRVRTANKIRAIAKCDENTECEHAYNCHTIRRIALFVETQS